MTFPMELVLLYSCNDRRSYIYTIGDEKILRWIILPTSFFLSENVLIISIIVSSM